MNDPVDGEWLAEHTRGAPEALRARSLRFFDGAPPGALVQRLASAGSAALSEATRDGASRAAALDLLAADALITLALLRAVADDPMNLERAAADLRRQVTAAA